MLPGDSVCHAHSEDPRSRLLSALRRRAPGGVAEKSAVAGKGSRAWKGKDGVTDIWDLGIFWHVRYILPPI